ncbi:hypothetical protein POSPLADRAFT_1160739 [Postia placenta MAD-698-R-SB12]|uniref:Uncharacterized protein n=1 Tax=Postia placenta MAD-698-R-SB12 TaxID=670580 RepID=A0A1X6MIR9_9APHY|nr:hypothetical protein POSPLADRAFT_1160739 [Postia placenta MAD-698-R-SB12]OSX56199.1 hypothetical protein POSPLADRAFT_1160739 [Postia placenta MAD-698-R-SB12]
MSVTLPERAVEEVLEYNFQQNCIYYACVALLIDHVALNDEQRLWGRRSIATLLSAINWLAITGTIITFMLLQQNTTQVGSIYLIIHPTRCVSIGYVYVLVFLVNSAISPLVAALRVHAVSGRNWRWVLPVWLLGMVPVGTNIWLTTQETWLVIPQIGCMSSTSMFKAYSNMYLPSPICTDTSVDVAPDVVAIITRVSVVVSDILVVAATWYYIIRTSSVRTQLVRDMWSAKPNLTTVMLRDEGKYVFADDDIHLMTRIMSLLNIGDLVVSIITISICSCYILDITNVITAMSSILISRFLICIREAAERSTQAFGSQSLSFVDSQGSAPPQPWLSSVEFASDIANRSAEDGHADDFPDLDDNDDNLDSGAEEEAQIAEEEIEMDE